MLANGLGEIKIMSSVAPIAAVVNLFLSIKLGETIGMQGVTLATAICILIFSILIVGGDILTRLRYNLPNPR